MYVRSETSGGFAGLAQPSGPGVTCNPPKVLDKFVFGDHNLPLGHQTTLDAVVRWVEALRKMKVDARVTLVGHTDNIGSVARNNVVSQKRADEVKKYLVARGVPVDSATGVGKSSPTALNDTDLGRAANRRVVITVCAKSPGSP